MTLDLRPFIRPGDTVVVGQTTGEPRSLVEALIEQRHHLAPIRVFVGGSFTGLFRAEHADAFDFRSFGVLGQTASLANAGVLSVMPIHVGTLPALMRSGGLRVDVLLAQVSEANAEGHHSFGLMADYLQAAAECARVVIGEVNPRVPFTFGDTLIPSQRINATTYDERPLIAVERRTSTPDDITIAGYVAGVIPDGATIQIGVGGTPDAVLAHLVDRNDIGVHSGLITDSLLDLIEAGVVTNARKEIDRGVTVAGALFGTDRLYQWADRNPALAMRSLSYTHDAQVLGHLGSFFAINSAVEIDLTGQINGESVGGKLVGLVGGQGAFARAALTSRTGRSVVALPSTARGRSTSRIVARLADGIVSTSRADADLVITEHGVADLRGASIQERIERLLAIADPAHVDELRAAAARP